MRSIDQKVDNGTETVNMERKHQTNVTLFLDISSWTYNWTIMSSCISESDREPVTNVPDFVNFSPLPLAVFPSNPTSVTRHCIPQAARRTFDAWSPPGKRCLTFSCSLHYLLIDSPYLPSGEPRWHVWEGPRWGENREVPITNRLSERKGGNGALIWPGCCRFCGLIVGGAMDLFLHSTTQIFIETHCVLVF